MVSETLVDLSRLSSVEEFRPVLGASTVVKRSNYADIRAARQFDPTGKRLNTNRWSFIWKAVSAQSFVAMRQLLTSQVVKLGILTFSVHKPGILNVMP